jgi:hypothetical protein
MLIHKECQLAVLKENKVELFCANTGNNEIGD